jgi:diguanylate cyclase (GGDEF)-like protein
VATAKRHKQFGAVIFLDLDHFKYLNDTKGHLIGDQLLVQVANRLLSVLREEDTPARLGGDEFVILLHANTEQANTANEQAWTVANKIKDALNKPVILDQCHHHISTSIGIALFPDQNKSTEVILQQADTAMYRAKANGRNSIEFFNCTMN